jgi:GNAT superfamily N-acetyltransferase
MTLEIRRYESGDEHGLVELYNLVFGGGLDLDRWRWLYRLVPLGVHEGVHVACDGDQIVGHLGAIPLTYLLRGEAVRAARSQDGYVHPDYRGRGLYYGLLEFAAETQQSLGVRYTMGFPNDNSFPAMTRGGWFEHLCDIFTLDLPRDRFTALADFASSLRVEWSRSPDFNPRDAELMERLLATHELRNSRSVDALNWRYRRETGRIYDCMRIFRGDELQGIAVIKLYGPGRSVDLLEFCFPADEPLLRRALSALIEHTRSFGPKSISVWSMAHFTLDEPLRELGFGSGTRATHVISCGPRPREKLEWERPDLHYLSMGDSDVY